MTNQTKVKAGVKEQVEQVIAGKILEKLAKLGAAEERTLKQHLVAVRVRHGGADHGFARDHTSTKTIPGSVYDATLRKLISQRQVRRVKITSGYLAGIVVVAHRDATGKEITKAAWTTFDEESRARVRQSTYFRREMHWKGVRESRLADAMPLTDPDDEVHYSEREDALTYEGSVADDALEAEIPSASEAAGTPVNVRRRLVVTEEVREKIRYQDRIGQGARNARRARARYLKTDPVMQQWFARKEMEENARREERRAFGAGDPTAAVDAPAMSPEQAHEDHHSL